MNWEKNDFKNHLLRNLIAIALSEDRVQDDVTTNALSAFDRRVCATVTAKEAGIISGTDVFCAVFAAVDADVKVDVLKKNGSPVQKGDLVITIDGLESSILKAERTALNFLQRLSGIASLAHRFVQILEPLGITLLDTRKTTPGMRYLEKQAVLDGGAANHRMNLEDMAMIKDNHVKMAGGITAAVRAIEKKFPGKRIEVEVRNLEELEEALGLKVYMIMLDNFTPLLQEEAVKRTKGRVKLEVSGNVNMDNVAAKAVKGIDFISVGALTHSFKSLDLSLNIDD